MEQLVQRLREFSQWFRTAADAGEIGVLLSHYERGAQEWVTSQLIDNEQHCCSYDIFEYGMPVIQLDSNRNPVACIPPATRCIRLFGSIAMRESCRPICEEAGAIISQLPVPLVEVIGITPLTLKMIQGESRFFRKWIFLIFEMSWCVGSDSLLHLMRTISVVGDQKIRVDMKWDIDEIRRLSTTPFKRHIPKEWLQRLPVAYWSEIKNLPLHSARLCDSLADQLEVLGNDAAAAVENGNSRAERTPMQKAGRPPGPRTPDERQQWSEDAALRKGWEAFCSEKMESGRRAMYRDFAELKCISEEELKDAIRRDRYRNK